MNQPVPAEFYPFYDPLLKDGPLSSVAKTIIACSVGGLYLLVFYWLMPEKSVFFEQSTLILGAIASSSLMALYIAAKVFRQSLALINRIEGNSRVGDSVVNGWLNNRWHLLSGLIWATLNVSVAHILGAPADFYSSSLILLMLYVGFFISGFTAGMGMLAIVAVIVLYLKLAPNLQHSLNPDDPDGTGGIKKLGDSLWFFGALVAANGILISAYLFGVEWANLELTYVRWVFLSWVALPYLSAVSIVLIPGLAVRRQVSYYKSYRTDQLRKEKAKLYSSFKEFEASDDDSIIMAKKEISDRLNRVHEQMDKLRKMRNSHIDGGEEY